MNGKILVTYASKYGSTREIAERIGDRLRESGLMVEVMPVNGFHDLESYRAVVLGSAVYIGKWQKQAEAFLRSNEKALSERSVWLFSSGPTGDGDALELLDGQLLPSALQVVVDRINPRDITVFHGNIDPKRANPVERWAVKRVVKKPFGDFRDWDSIDAWANTIAGSLNGGKHPQ